MDNNTIFQQVSALNNALKYYNLTGYKIHEYYQQDKRIKTQLYFLTDEKGNSLTGHWDYSELNNFISGYGKAASEYDKLKEQNNSLLEALKEIVASYKMCVKKADQSEYVINAEAAIQKAEQ